MAKITEEFVKACLRMADGEKSKLSDAERESLVSEEIFTVNRRAANNRILCKNFFFILFLVFIFLFF